MNQAYQIPKRTISAEILLTGLAPLSLKLYLSDHIESRVGNERPSDLLNGPDRFFPAADASDQVVFLHRDAVVTVAVEADAEFGGYPPSAEALAPEQATNVPVEISLTNGDQVTGTLVYLMPEGSRRLQDALNQPNRFLALRAGDQAFLINKKHILRIRPV